MTNLASRLFREKGGTVGSTDNSHVGRGQLTHWRRYHEAESETSNCVWRRSGALVRSGGDWRWAVGLEPLEYESFIFNRKWRVSSM